MSAAWGTRGWTRSSRLSPINRAVCTKVVPCAVCMDVVPWSDALSVHLVLGPRIFTPCRSFSQHCAPFGPFYTAPRHKREQTLDRLQGSSQSRYGGTGSAWMARDEWVLCCKGTRA